MKDPDLERVKEILTGDVRESIQNLQDNFESDAFADKVAEVVAEALAKRSSKDDLVADVLAPTIDQAIAGSIDQDPKKLAKSLYPVMGPAIRKSISETLQQMLENFNQLLEESVSPQSLRWRFDAWRTGKSYSELVMLNTLEYRIEQVFLIHRETSLLIQHQLSDLADAKDPDMVSSMFSAIQDFIEDSFATDETNELNTLRLGDLTVLIQRGPDAVLASVIRGRVPEKLRQQMIELLESLHRRKRAELSEYSGDPDDFLDIEPDVRELLQVQKKTSDEKERKIPWLALVSIAVLLLATGYWQWIGSTISKRQQDVLGQLQSEPGIVLLSSNQSRDKLAVRLLVDPNARGVDSFVETPDLEDKFGYQLEFEATPFLSLDSKILQRRAEPVLAPSNQTELTIVGQTVVLAGSSSRQWLSDAEARWPSITGATGLDTSNLTVVDYELAEVEALASEIENFSFEFDKGQAKIDADSEQFLQLLTDLTDLISAVDRYGLNIRIDIVGFTDPTGSEQVNRVIGKNRAAEVASKLVERGIPEWLLSTYHSHNYEAVEETDLRETRLIVFIDRDDP